MYAYELKDDQLSQLAAFPIRECFLYHSNHSETTVEQQIMQAPCLHTSVQRSTVNTKTGIHFFVYGLWESLFLVFVLVVFLGYHANAHGIACCGSSVVPTVPHSQIYPEHHDVPDTAYEFCTSSLLSVNTFRGQRMTAVSECYISIVKQV